MSKFFLCILFCPLFLFAQKANHSDSNSYVLSNDTLFSKFSRCNTKAQKFYKFSNVIISGDYFILDSLRLGINSDKLTDWILVLSPYIQEEREYQNKCFNTSFNQRLFVILLSDKKGYHIGLVNDRLILNITESQSDPYRRLKATKEGFELQFFLGSSLKYYYNFFFTNKNGVFYLYKYDFESYKIDLSKTKKRQYKLKKGMDISRLNIRDYLVE